MRLSLFLTGDPKMLPGFDNDRPPCLRLEVVAHGGQAPAQKLACIFEQKGGSLGRSMDNDLVLPDAEGVVSRVHAAIVFHDGAYFLVDKSTNGTFLNNAPQRLVGGQEHLLSEGDTISIGDFSIVVRLVAGADEASRMGITGGGERLIDMSEPQPEEDPFAIGQDALQDLAEKDGWSSDARRPDWFPAGEAEEESAGAPSKDAGAGDERPPVPIMQHHMARPAGPPVHEDAGPSPPVAPPAAQGPSLKSRVPTGYVPFGNQFDALSDGQLIPDAAPSEPPTAPGQHPPPVSAEPSAPEATSDPEMYQPVVGRESVITERPQEVTAGVAGDALARAGRMRSPPGSSPDAQLFEAFLRGLDVPSLHVPPEEAGQFMEQIGRMVRESVQGLIDTLRLRAEFKREFYVPATSIAPVENNLYKYSVNVDDAMSRLMSDSRSAYMGPAESTRQAFQDVAAHHLALVAGMEAAVRTILQRFSPEALQERIGKASMLEGMLPQVRRARMWEEFETEYQQIADQAEEDFQEILGQNFARAYTEQISRLERAGFGGRKTENEQS